MERNEVKLPPPYCSSICRNSMNDFCIERCSPKGDMSDFEPKKGDIQDYPPFPMDEFIHTMTPNERKVIMAVYMAKAVDFIQGRKAEANDRFPSFPGRSVSYGPRHSEDPQSMPSESVSSNTRNETCEVREEYPSTTIGVSEVAGGTHS